MFFVSACRHQQVFWVPCVHADMYYVCRNLVGMDVEFVKLVYVDHSLEADKSRRGVEIFLFLRVLGGKASERDDWGGGRREYYHRNSLLFFLWSFFF